VDPVSVGPLGGPLVYEQLWMHVRHGLIVVGWVIFLGLVAAASCWCCGYVVRGDLGAPESSPRRRRDGRHISLPDETVAEEAERGIREIELFLSRV
jgi:hypothetical protein